MSNHNKPTHSPRPPTMIYRPSARDRGLSDRGLSEDERSILKTLQQGRGSARAKQQEKMPSRAGVPSRVNAPVSLPHPNINSQLPENGPGYRTYGRSEHRYGLPQTIQALQAIATAWHQAHPNGPRIGIGDISLRGGGDTPRHNSHDTGLDVDILPMRNDGRERGVRYQDTEHYSRPLTQELVDKIRSNGMLQVQYIFFNDALVRGRKDQKDHDNHLHVRFFPPGAQS